MTTYNAPEAWEVRPPSGWRYGFPKVITQQYMDRFRYYHEPDAAIRSFLREHKYPEWLITSCDNWYTYLTPIKQPA